MGHKSQMLSLEEKKSIIDTKIPGKNIMKASLGNLKIANMKPELVGAGMSKNRISSDSKEFLTNLIT